jgi:hypothetical protein
MDSCENCGTKQLPENNTACGYGDNCMACEDCVCPDCYSCKFKHCSCDSEEDNSEEESE